METDRLLQPSFSNVTEHNDDVNHTESHVTYNSIDSSQTGQIHKPRSSTHVYKLRWYILFVFSLSTTLQNAAWGTWGPIAQSAKAAYDWTNPLLTVIINCGNIGVFLALVPSAFLISYKGIRPTVIVCTFCLGLGCGLRIISLHPPLTTVLIGAGQFFIGVAGSVTTIIPSVISETWFPVNERTTATAIGIISNAIGGIVAFILGPNIVTQPLLNNNTECMNKISNNLTGNCTEVQTIEEEIRLLLLIEFIWGAVLFGLSVLYFPTKPQLPPSLSASLKRLNFGEAFRGIIRKPNVIQVSVVCAIPWACFGNWLGLLDLTFHDVGVTQTQAGWYGFYAYTSGTVSGMVISRVIDLFRRKHRLVLSILYISALLFILWISAISNGYLPTSHVLDAVAISLLSVSLNSAMPVLYELACELAYPAGEEMIGLFIGIIKNATAVLFLLVGIVQTTGTQWMNWTVLGVIALSIPILLTVKIQYNRINLDTTPDNKYTENTTSHIQSDS